MEIRKSLLPTTLPSHSPPLNLPCLSNLFPNIIFCFRSVHNLFLFLVATESPEEVLKEQYLNAIKPPSPPPVSRAQPKRPINEWEKDKIELAELKHAKSVLRSRKFPSYFDTEQGLD